MKKLLSIAVIAASFVAYACGSNIENAIPETAEENSLHSTLAGETIYIAIEKRVQTGATQDNLTIVYHPINDIPAEVTLEYPIKIRANFECYDYWRPGNYYTDFEETTIKAGQNSGSFTRVKTIYTFDAATGQDIVTYNLEIAGYQVTKLDSSDPNTYVVR